MDVNREQQRRVELNRLAVAQRRMERRLAGTTLRDRRTNEWLRGVTKVVDVVDEAQKRKWSYAWMGRMGQERWLSALLQWRPGTTRRVGRPRARRRTIQEMWNKELDKNSE